MSQNSCKSVDRVTKGTVNMAKNIFANLGDTAHFFCIQIPDVV